MTTAQDDAQTEKCGFCENGTFVSSRRESLGLPPEVPCPYCDATGEVQ